MPGGQSLKAIERLSFESHTRHPWVNRNLRVPAPISPFQHGKEFRRLFDTLLLGTTEPWSTCCTGQPCVDTQEFADQWGITDRARTRCHESWSDGRCVAVGDVPLSNGRCFTS